MARLISISEKEIEMLEAWAKHGSLKAASEALDIPLSTLSNRKSKLRWRYRRARQFIREVDKWMARLPGALE